MAKGTGIPPKHRHNYLQGELVREKVGDVVYAGERKKYAD